MTPQCRDSNLDLLAQALSFVTNTSLQDLTILLTLGPHSNGNWCFQHGTNHWQESLNILQYGTFNHIVLFYKIIILFSRALNLYCHLELPVQLI